MVTGYVSQNTVLPEHLSRLFTKKCEIIAYCIVDDYSNERILKYLRKHFPYSKINLKGVFSEEELKELSEIINSDKT